MAMFKKIAGKAKPLSKKDAEKIVKANRRRLCAPNTEETADEQQPKKKK